MSGFLPSSIRRLVISDRLLTHLKVMSPQLQNGILSSSINVVITNIKTQHLPQSHED